MGRAAPRLDGEEAVTLEDAGALKALRLDWGHAWDIGGGGTRWQAESRDGTGPMLTRASAAGLEFALRISAGRRPWLRGRPPSRTIPTRSCGGLVSGSLTRKLATRSAVTGGSTVPSATGTTSCAARTWAA
jgi:hypothetical protein